MAGEKRFNGTTVSFNSVTYSALLNAGANSKAKAIDVGGCDDTDVENELGRIDKAASLEVVGQTVPTIDGVARDLVITWKSGTSLTYEDMLLDGVDITGSIDGSVTMKLTFIKGVTTS